VVDAVVGVHDVCGVVGGVGGRGEPERKKRGVS